METYNVLKKLVSKETKVVLVWGWPGIGKSTLLRNLSNFCAERNFFKNGAIFINISEVSTIEEFLIMMVDTFNREIPGPSDLHRATTLRGISVDKLKKMLREKVRNFN
jgi:nucleoside-triphosphatase THEP1